MTDKKVAKRAIVPIVTESEEKARGRLADALREFATREGVAPSAAHERLADGWPLLQRRRTAAYKGRPAEILTEVNEPSQPWLKKLLQRKGLPKGDMFLALCKRLDLNAEWVLTGLGPRRRTVVASGGTLNESELAREFSAHLLGACEAEVSARRVVSPPWGAAPWGADAATLLREVTAHVVDIVLHEHDEHTRIASVMGPVSELAALALDGADEQGEQFVADRVRKIGERTRGGARMRKFPIGPIELPALPQRRKTRQSRSETAPPEQ